MKILSGKPGKITPKILSDQTRFSYDVFPVVAAMLAIAALTITFLVWRDIGQQQALLCFAAAVSLILLRFISYYAFRAATDPDANAQFWRKLFLAGAYLTALMLSVAGFIFLPELTQSGQTVFTLLIIGVVSGSLPVLALNLNSYGFYVTATLLPAVYWNIASSEMQLKLLGTLIAVYIGMLMLSAYLFNRAMIDSLIYRYRSETLAERLQVANQRLSTANEELQRISTVDELTGAYNRRYFNQRFDEVWADHLREGMMFSALMIDVDFFKIYNDNFGHLQGDSCLRRIAAEIMEVIHRPRDFVARFGGEEFIVLLPNTKLPGAKEIAQRLHQRIERLAIPHKRPDKLGRVTISIGGAAVQPTKEATEDTFLQRIDHALYQAKSTGRNKSVFV
jgi:diguanylate cyclase (GGDEF)-like protein